MNQNNQATDNKGVCEKNNTNQESSNKEPKLSQNLKDNISPCCFSTLEWIPNKTYKRCRTCGTCHAI